jgi:hypothetical protein
MSLNIDRSAWKRVAFGDVIANINDYFNPDVDGVLPYVAGPHINAGQPTVADYGSTDDDHFPPTFKRKFQAGDVLLHSRGIEKLASVSCLGVTGEKLFVLRSKDEDTLLQGFVVWLLQSQAVRAHMRENFTGSVNKFLNWKPLAAMELDLPPLDEQKRIADLLWALERHELAVGASRRDVGSTRDCLNASTFPRWLEISRVKLDTLYDFQIGKRLSPEGRARGGDSFPYVTNFNVQWREIDFSEVRDMDFLKREQPVYEISPGDVLACEARFVGRSAVWPEGRAGHKYQMSLHRLRHKSGSLRPHMLVEYLDWCAKSGFLRRAVGDNLIPHLPEVRFRQIDAPVPTEDAAMSFEAAHGVLAAGLAAVEAELTVLAALRSSMLIEIFGDN